MRPANRLLAITAIMAMAGCGGTSPEEEPRAHAASAETSPESPSPSASPSPTTSPSPSPSPTRPAFVQLRGHLSIPYVMGNGDCRQVTILEFSDDLVEQFSALLAKQQIEKVESQTVEFRDSTGAIVAEATTPGRATLKRTFEATAKDLDVCLAFVGFSVQLPASDVFAMSVSGVPNAPDPVTYEELEARGFVCNLHISTTGELLEDDPCDGGGWVASVT
jgi:hypothetical protein